MIQPLDESYFENEDNEEPKYVGPTGTFSTRPHLPEWQFNPPPPPTPPPPEYFLQGIFASTFCDIFYGGKQ